MTSLALPPEPTPAFAPGELTDIQLRVARRADELARRFHANRDTDRRLWLRAEFEVFERAERVQPAITAVASEHRPWR